MELWKYLKSGRGFDEPIDYVKMIETHISWVFLTGRYAYKIKKPVNYGFIDYSTLEKRKFFSYEEIRINRRFSPAIYIGVLPISKKGGEYRVGDDENVIEYAVKMLELPQSSIMSKLVIENKINEDYMFKIADIVYTFHENSEPIVEDGFGDKKRAYLDSKENFEQSRRLRGTVIEEDRFDEIERRVFEFIEQKGDVFEKRVKEGRVRECHGDLHTGNIFIYKGKVYIFDAIEFNKRFSNIDVASDIAFFIMDLEILRREDLAYLFLRKYTELSRDVTLKDILNFYICYRAWVRAKVESFKIPDSELENPEKTKKIKEYLLLAECYSERF